MAMLRSSLLALLLFTCLLIIYINTGDLTHQPSSVSASLSSESKLVRFSVGRFLICRRDEYRCDGRLPRCVHRSLLCDRNADCPLGDDETDCVHMSQCNAGFYFCHSKKSVTKSTSIDENDKTEPTLSSPSSLIYNNREHKLRLIREIGECVEINLICNHSVDCYIKNKDHRERLCHNFTLTPTTSTSLIQQNSTSIAVESITNLTYNSLQTSSLAPTSSTISSKPAFTSNQSDNHTESSESSNLLTDLPSYSLKDIENMTSFSLVSKSTLGSFVTQKSILSTISSVYPTTSKKIVANFQPNTLEHEHSQHYQKKHRDIISQEVELTTSMTHIEHVSEVPSGSFDFQPFFKPYFNADQIPFGDFMNSAAKKKPNSQTDATAKSNNDFDYTKQFDFHKFMKGGGDGKSEMKNGGKSNFGGFDYSKYMKGGQTGKSSGKGSTSFGGFDYSKFMNQGGASQPGATSNSSDQNNNKTNSSGFNYSQYTKGGGSGSFDYSTYMSGKPPKEVAKKGVKLKYHKADYLKFYEDNSEEKGMKGNAKKDDDSIDFVAVDHRELKQLKKANQTRFSNLSNDTDEFTDDKEFFTTDQYSFDKTSTITDDYSNTGDPQHNKHYSNSQQAHPIQKWIPHSASASPQIPGEKGNKVNVSKIIPKTMLNGYSYTHYGSGVFFINFGTIVNGNSNIMGSGNDVGNGNANGNNNGNTQGDNLKSNTNNRHQELESKESS